MNPAFSLILRRQTDKIKTEYIGVRFKALLLTHASYCKFPFVYHNLHSRKRTKETF